MEKTRRAGKQHQINESCTIKPFNNSPLPIPDQTLESSAAATAVTDLPSISNHPNTNRKRYNRNRRAKPRLINKSESSSSVVEPSSPALVEEKCGEREDVQEEAAELSDDNCTASSKIEVYEEIDPGEDSFDVATCFEKLQLRTEEPELLKEQLNLNLQLQEDELLALESIYGDNTMILAPQRGLPCLKVHIHIEIPEKISISSKLSSSSDIKAKNGVSDDFLYSFKVQYLPPIELTCLLPKSYPSHIPPYFMLSVKWLDSISISHLCLMLDSIWNEQKGHEIIYQWVEWLHGSSFLHLGLDKEITLGPYGTHHSWDSRAISGHVAPDADILSLKNYNDTRCHENFVKNLHDCCICFSEYTGAEFITLPCQHFFCWKCMKIYANMHVKEGTVNKLLCPNTKCDVMLPPGLLKRLLGDEEYERWESLILERTLASMSDVAYCPRCEAACIEDGDQHAQCPECYFSFCTLCSDKRHVGTTCMTPEMKLRILEERQNSSQLKGGQRAKEREMINEILSLKEIYRDSKQCPSCNIAISRVEGCNKMVCSNCGQYFCYRCNKAITGYEHFREGTCDLFPQAMIQNWEERVMNPRQLLGQAQAWVQAELFAGHGQTCPHCGQFNGKIGNNNHMFCWACQARYCYLCKSVVRRGSQHFRPNGCKQHSDG